MAKINFDETGGAQQVRDFNQAITTSSTLFNLLHQEYKKGGDHLKKQYKDVLYKEIVSNLSKDLRQLTSLFSQIAHSTIGLTISAPIELKLYYYNDAAIACQYVLQITKGKDNQELKKLEQEAYVILQLIQKNMVEICGGDFTKIIPICDRKDIDTLSHKADLQALRDKIKESLKLVEEHRIAKNDEFYINGAADMFKDIAIGMERHLAGLYKKAEEIMGSPPCKYTIIGFGSMALRQMTPYSDLECAILTDNEKYKDSTDPQVKHYFKNLSHLVNFMIINLGETIIPTSRFNLDLSEFIPQAVNFDLGGKTPLGRIEQDKPYELVQTVKGMLHYLKNEENKAEHIDKNLPSILQKTCYVYGDKKLAEEYQTEAQRFLEQINETGKTNYESRAIKSLWEGIEEIDYTKSSDKPKNIEGNLKQFNFDPIAFMGRLFDVKQEIYRLPDRLIYNFGLIYGIQEDSSWDTLDKLHERDIINKEGANNLKKALSFAAILRLKTYDHYGYQKESMDYNKAYNRDETVARTLDEGIFDTFELGNQDLKPGGALFEYYNVAIPLLEGLKSFCEAVTLEQREKFFNSILFYEDNAGTKAKIHLRLIQYEEAIKQQLLELEELKAKFGLEHPDVITSLHNVGETYKELGKHDLALHYKLEALELKKKLFGSEHPDVARSLSSVGESYVDLGKYEKAIQYQLEALNLRSKLFTPEHLDVATSLHDVGYTYDGLSKYEEALQYKLKALELIKKLLGREHPDVASIINNVGYTYNALGKHELALQYQLEALVLRKKLFGSEHPDVAQSLNNVGCTYGDLGNHELALQYQLEALELKKKLLGSEHPDVAQSLNNVGTAYVDVGKYKLALQYLLEGLKLRNKLLGSEHPDVAQSLDNVGYTYGKLSKHELALQYKLGALELKKTSLGPEHLDVARSLNSVGYTYGDLGKHRLALQYRLEALELRKKLLGHEHPNVVQSLDNVGYTYERLGNYQKGYEYSIKAFKLAQRYLGEENPGTIVIKQNIDFCAVSLRKFQQACKIFEKAEKFKIVYNWIAEKSQSQKQISKKLANIEQEYKKALLIFKEIDNNEYALKSLKAMKELYKKHSVLDPNKHKTISIEKQIMKYQNAMELANELKDDIELTFPIKDLYNFSHEDNTSLPVKSTNTTRLVSYNIAADYFDNKDKTEDTHHHWKFRSPYVIKLLESVCPDIMCLQELSPDQALELHEYFSGKGYSSAFLSQTPSEIEAGLIVFDEEVKSWREKNIGTPLVGTFISKACAFIETGKFWLNENPDLTPEHTDRGTTCKGFGNMNTFRAVLWAKIQVGDEKTLFVFNSHYPLSGGNKARLECAIIEMQKIKEITKEADWVSAGDKNIIPTEDDNKLSNPQTVKTKLAEAGYDIHACKKHYGITTSWIGFSYETCKNPIKNGKFEDGIVLDLMVSSLNPALSFSLHGGFNPVTTELLPLTGALGDEQDQTRYFASDHALIGADLSWG